MCPCGKYRQACPQCNPLGHLVDLTRRQVRRCSPRLTDTTTPSEPPDCLGCTGEKYDEWLESQFHDGMTWDNYGRGEGMWQVDHILAFFDETNPATTEEEVLRRFHYTNTQPLWSKDNMSKGIK